jgi:hypothetical protein
MASEKKNPYSAESVREWSLKILMKSAEASIDISRCGDPEYIATLSPMQINKLKRVVYGGKGNIVSVEPLSVVDFAVAAANIAGTREIAKQQAEKEKEKSAKHRSEKLELSIVGKTQKTETPPKKPAKKNDSGDVSDLLQNLRK